MDCIFTGMPLCVTAIVKHHRLDMYDMVMQVQCYGENVSLIGACDAYAWQPHGEACHDCRAVRHPDLAGPEQFSCSNGTLSMRHGAVPPVQS